MKIKNKIAIVTGASSGIGLSTAKLLTEKGAKVALVARSKEKLTKLSKTLKNSLVVQADMSNEIDVKKMIKKVYKHYGRIDILINNAGQGYDASITDINISTFRKVFDLDLVGPIVAMQQAILLMRKQKQGVIVNISSGTALMYLPNMGAYSSLKRALAQISLTAREELKNKNISVGVVYPYITDTDFEKNTIKHHKQIEEENDNIPHPPDSADYVAKKILQAITTEKAEIFAHDWMKNLS